VPSLSAVAPQRLGQPRTLCQGCVASHDRLRAAPFAHGSDEFTARELYLMQRAAGMTLEAPAVRP